MTFDDVVVNLHLYNRLFVALGMVTKFMGYDHSPEWLADLCTVDELRAALAVHRAREDGGDGS